MFEDIIVEGVVQPRGAPVALLYSETTEIWREAEGPIDKKTGKTELGPLRGDQNSAMADFRTGYLALKHANLEVDVLIEGDAGWAAEALLCTLRAVDPANYRSVRQSDCCVGGVRGSARFHRRWRAAG